MEHHGDRGIRTLDLLLARQALSQLSYIPGFRSRTAKLPEVVSLTEHTTIVFTEKKATKHLSIGLMFIT